MHVASYCLQNVTTKLKQEANLASTFTIKSLQIEVNLCHLGLSIPILSTILAVVLASIHCRFNNSIMKYPMITCTACNEHHSNAQVWNRGTSPSVYNNQYKQHEMYYLHVSLYLIRWQREPGSVWICKHHIHASVCLPWWT